MSEICSICGNKLIPRFLNIPDSLTSLTFTIYKCPKCRLGHTIPQPENLTAHYDNYYGNRHGFTANYCTKRRLRFAVAAMKKQPGKRLLDIGCGDGSFLLAARDAGWDVMGTEINPEPGRAAGLDVRENISQMSDCAQFDCITMWHTLEHMRDIKSTLSQLSDLLKPNGKLLIAVPDNGGLQARFFKGKWLHLDVPRHLYHFDAESLSFCLKRAGFTVQHQWHQELEYDLIGWSQSALNCLLPTSNVFLDQITGKQGNHTTLIKTSSFVLGSIRTVLSLPAVAVENC